MQAGLTFDSAPYVLSNSKRLVEISHTAYNNNQIKKIYKQIFIATFPRQRKEEPIDRSIDRA